MLLIRSKLLLLSGASVLAILPVQKAAAQLATQVKPGSVSSGSTATAGVASVRPLSAAAQTALDRQLQSKARAASTVDLARQAQAAARVASVRNLTGPVRNGLGLGALQPAVNVRTPAGGDPTGILTWDGAALPTQSANAQGGFDVTVQQDQQHAILSWTTFNVGKDTSLTFDQKGNKDWVAVNRVVGQLDPATGRRDASLAPAPSQILGKVKADGTVLVINQNGIIFGATAQINTRSLMASSLELGVRATAAGIVSQQQRNLDFLEFGINGIVDRAAASATIADSSYASGTTFSSQLAFRPNFPFGGLVAETLIEGGITIEAGAQISAGTGGLALIVAPTVENHGTVTASDGQVALLAGRGIGVRRSTGSAAAGGDPYLRGLAFTLAGDFVGYVRNTGLVLSPRGNIQLAAAAYTYLGPATGAVINSGVLASTTSVSHNGSIYLQGSDIQLAPGSVIAIEADTGAETIPQDAQSIADFKTSQIRLGSALSRVEIAGGALVRAPGGGISIGTMTGTDTPNPGVLLPGSSRIFIDDGAVLDVGGMKDVAVDATRNQIVIAPVKKNELVDTPLYRDSFLNGATVYVDPRLSGVRTDGVAWIGSPLIEAGSYYAQVGVKAEELLTRGGTITLGTRTWSGITPIPLAPDLIVKSGAVLDISGGWTHYQAGSIVTSQLVTTDGRVVDISRADPNEAYVGFAGATQVVSPRWGTVKNYQNSFFSGTRQAPAYIEGRDAGALILRGSAMAIDASLYAQAFAGSRQNNDAVVGSAKGALVDDARHLQGASSQLPSAGLLSIEVLNGDVNARPMVMGAVEIVAAKDYSPIAADVAYDQKVSVGADGKLALQTRSPEFLPGADALHTLTLSDALLSKSGIADFALTAAESTLLVADGANVVLAPGGSFAALAMGKITIDGSITVPSGQIVLVQALATGSGDSAPGDFDVVVNGTLSTRGLWVNDLGLTPELQQGGAWIDGGSISITSSARMSDTIAESFDQPITDTTDIGAVTSVDLSASILISAGAVIDLSSGGRVRADGSLDLSGRGGDLSLVNETTFFQVGSDDAFIGHVSGFRVALLDPRNSNFSYLAVNPDKITSRVSIAGDAIRAHGFAGGGTFNLTTPEIVLGNAPQGNATVLDLGYFSRTGFADYNVVSYKTELTPNAFDNRFGGTQALLATQTLTVGASETLTLRQSVLPSVLTGAQRSALMALQSGGDVTSVVQASVPVDVWDQQAVNLSLGGLIELKVAAGGRIEGAPGARLGVSRLLNEGTIHLPGGTIHQQITLPGFYAGALAVRDLAEIFGPRDANGHFAEGAVNAMGIRGSVNGNNILLTNRQLLGKDPSIYMLGALDADVGIALAPGSVTDLAGVSILDPRAQVQGRGSYRNIRTGRLIDGGTVETAVTANLADHVSASIALINRTNLLVGPVSLQIGGAIQIDDGARLDLSGALDNYDQPQLGTTLAGSIGFQSTAVWSDGGRLTASQELRLASGAVIDAHGGTPAGFVDPALGSKVAQGGTLAVDNLKLVQHANSGIAGAVSVDAIGAAGFSTLVAIGAVQGSGDVDLNLDGGRGQFFLLGRGYDLGLVNGDYIDTHYIPTVRSDGGTLRIAADYIGIDSGSFSMIAQPGRGKVDDGVVEFAADTIDITGAVLFDRSVGSATLSATGDIRLTGLQPYENTVTGLGSQSGTAQPSLKGMIAANGDLTLAAAQIYPTTGSAISISSLGANSTVRFARSGNTLPASPYSAGGALSVYAANIAQDGVVRVPLGSLNLGSATPFTFGNGLNTVMFAPATQSITVSAGSVTSVSAAGLAIPYGITTDGKEWYFSPSTNDTLATPPKGVLQLSGKDIAINAGATVDLSGGGDVTAYEFVPGTGGSYDELNRYNEDAFSGNDGLQFPDGRQVYAIVPGLSQQAVAARDPIYSSDYAGLYQAGGVGSRVYLDGAPGLAAGWYTLLPAQYAMLPGGMRVVEMTGARNVAAGTVKQFADGTTLVSGTLGNGAGANPGRSLFSVQNQSTILKHSNIQVTSGSSYFAAKAARAGLTAPPLPIDAGRLVLVAGDTLRIDSVLKTNVGAGGRGASVDVAGSSIAIVSDLAQNVGANAALRVTADSLTRLNANSLLIGGTRTNNADGTTSLTITAQTIDIANDAAHPLTAPEIILAVDDLVTGTKASSIALADGATIVASGTANASTGNYVVDARTQVVPIPGTSDGKITTVSTMTGEGAILRVANGPERLIVRLPEPTRPASPAASLAIGAATLSGQSILADSSGNTAIAPRAQLLAKNIAIGAGQITFTNDPAAVASGLVVTGDLLATLDKADRLTLRSPHTIDFTAGDYTLKQVRLDSGGLRSLGGDVSLSTGSLELSNSYGGSDACTAAGALACGGATLAINTGTLVVGPGTIGVYGFGNEVSIRADQGIFSRGVGGLDVGAAALSLATPFIGDRAEATVGDNDPIVPSLTLATTGALTITRPAGNANVVPAGVPGASLKLSGGSIAVSGTTLQSTAGTVEVRSAGGIALSDGARILAPGYTKTFGDAVDPVTADSPGGRVTMVAVNGDIALGTGTTVSVGGAKGSGGTLELLAANGMVRFDGTIDGKAPGGGSSLTLDTAGAYDLAAIGASANAMGFTRALDIRTRTGDLTLAAGQTLTSGSVKLSADGGLLTIAGTIRTAGIEGGDVALLGLTGVTLAATAVIDASATGYAADDSRTAHAGDVTLGTDGNGAITIHRGAVIDLAAKRPGDRLVRLIRNGETFYQYAAADQGGTLTLRAPVLVQAGTDTVNVDVADAASVRGAGAVELVGFKRWDLVQAATSGRYSGVTLNAQTGAITLDVAAGLDTPNANGTTTSVAGLNLLGDYGDGTVVQFVQDFDVSAAFGRLGGLASLASFRSRAGIDLVSPGGITLASNWNLGAGVVDVTGAVAAGLMTQAADGASVVAGREGTLLSDFTHFTYRPGGSIRAGAPMVSVRAGGDLLINGAISDGSFMLANGPFTNLGILPSYTSASATTPTFNFNNSGLSLAIYYPTGGVYKPALNSPASTAITNNNMTPFPTLADGFAPQSASFALVAGAAPGAIDPTRLALASNARLIVSEGAAGVVDPLSYDLLFDASPRDRDPDTDRVGLDQLTQAYEAINGSGALLAIAFGGNAARFPQSVIAVRNFNTAFTSQSDPALNALAAKYGRSTIRVTGTTTGTVTAPVEVITYFLRNYFVAGLRADLPAFYSLTGTDTSVFAGGPAFAQNVIRTGTGSIALAAPGTIGLYDPARSTAATVGGARIYTTGVQAAFAPRTLADPVTQASVTVAAPSLPVTPIDSEYKAGASTYYLTGGGDISLDAGGDVLNRRGLDSQYLVGNVGTNTRLAVQLGYYRTFAGGEERDLVGVAHESFDGGVAAFGGGNVSINAGQDIVAMAAVSSGSAVTSLDGRTLIAFGDGDLTVRADRDVLGGSFDIWSGSAIIAAGRDIAGAGTARLFDAEVAISAQRNLEFGDVAAFTAGRVSAIAIVDNPTGYVNNFGFFAERSALRLVANGGIALDGSTAVLPGTLTATALTGDLNILNTLNNSLFSSYDRSLVLVPSTVGQLELLAGGSIGPAVVAMLDADPGQLPGIFSEFVGRNTYNDVREGFAFPVILSNTSEIARGLHHNASGTHLGDDRPVRVYAGRDVGNSDFGLTLWVPKQARITAGRDVVNMVLFGQNLAATDVTRVVAGRDVIGTSRLVQPTKIGPPQGDSPTSIPDGPVRAAVQGNVFVLGGPGALSVEAGRDAGPFLTSAAGSPTFVSYGSPSYSYATALTFGGGVMSVGNEWNPWLSDQGANVTVMFGVAGGVNYDGLRDVYLDPANLANLDGDLFEQMAVGQNGGTVTVDGTVPDRTRPIYAPILLAWLKANAAAELAAAAGGTTPGFAQAYAVFKALPVLRQRDLLNQVYFNELRQPAVPDSPSYQQYARGYGAVNVLFPATWGYTRNELDGGGNGANSLVKTGDLDLRLATIQTARGGNVTILGPGGNVLAGSTVRTSAQAARRASVAGPLFGGTYSGLLTNPGGTLVPSYASIAAIPSGYEGVLTLRGGSISTFTDGNFLLNQSRLFTRQGGDIIMWSSNADLNAGQGPKTSSNFPPVVVRIDANLISEEDRVASTTGAGIAAFQPTVDSPAPDVYLLAPRGTVDAGDAGVRVAGNLFVGALRVANADNFQVQGKTFGIPKAPTVDVSGNLAASNTAAAAALEATAVARTRPERPLTISVTVEGFGDEPATEDRTSPKP